MISNSKVTENNESLKKSSKIWECQRFVLSLHPEKILIKRL